MCTKFEGAALNQVLNEVHATLERAPPPTGKEGREGKAAVHYSASPPELKGTVGRDGVGSSRERVREPVSNRLPFDASFMLGVLGRSHKTRE